MTPERGSRLKRPTVSAISDMAAVGDGCFGSCAPVFDNAPV
jgi:hypothetical protein